MNEKRTRSWVPAVAIFAAVLASCALSWWLSGPPTHRSALRYGLVAQARAEEIVTNPRGPVISTPAITITTATADTESAPSTGATAAHVQWKFGTVAGSFTTCTVQAKTTYDGTNYLTLGSAASVTATSTTLNAWTILAQAPTTSVTTSAVSATAALGFGQRTKFTFACSGSYGTSAPVTVTAIYQ